MKEKSNENRYQNVYIFFNLDKIQLKSVNFRHKFSSPDNQSTTQLTFTCSKLPLETLEKGVKYVQSYQ